MELTRHQGQEFTHKCPDCGKWHTCILGPTRLPTEHSVRCPKTGTRHLVVLSDLEREWEPEKEEANARVS